MSLILTPNRRLTNFLEAQYTATQIQNKQVAWLEPDIKPIMSWVRSMFAKINIVSNTPSMVIDSMQACLIAEQIIVQSKTPLLNIHNAAREVVNAVEIIDLWQRPLTELEKYMPFYADTAMFVYWARKFYDFLQVGGFLTPAKMLLQVAQNLHLLGELPAEIIFYAFDEINPLQQFLVEQLQDKGIICSFDSGVPLAPKAYKHACVDFEDEYLQAAKWAASELIKNPHLQLGIVIPNLTQDRKIIADIFGAQITVDKLNISAPVSIKKYVMIDLALAIFKICNSKFKYVDLLAVIKNPYICSSVAMIEENAKLIYMLQDRVEYYTNLASISARIDSSFLLAQRFALLQHYLPQLEDHKNAREWIVCLNEILAIFQWPCVDEMSLTEQHLLTCFNNIFEQYLFLDNLKPKHTFAQALEYINDLCENIPFLPVDSGMVHVHVLGLLEGVGLQFDKIWVTNMARELWPAEPRPNPFIPQVYQQQHNMPHSSAARELQIAQNLTNRLLVCAHEQLIFSYSSIQDGFDASCSFLIKDFPVLSVIDEYIIPENVENYLEDVVEPQVFNILNNTTMSAQLLKYQAECSFKAFASHSLQLRQFTMPNIFLSASERGQILHQALAIFWRIHQNHQTLVLLHSSNRLIDEVAVICQQVMNLWQMRKPFTLTQEYCVSETSRLSKLVSGWLLMEISREPFSVLAIEERHSVLINGVTINCQIDRIDLLTSGAKIVLDYKTGQVALNHWLSAPLLAPQLPIYALTQDNASLVAVGYAIVRADEVKFLGVGIEKNCLPNLQAGNFTKLLVFWQTELNMLVEKFTSQAVSVNPVNKQSCLYCNFHQLCRIYDVQ